jgi:hypothetical protein
MGHYEGNSMLAFPGVTEARLGVNLRPHTVDGRRSMTATHTVSTA